MTTTMVRDLLRQRPFRPFRVVMSSGDAYEVRNPEMAWVTKVLYTWFLVRVGMGCWMMASQARLIM